ncbi:MAG TPA: divalent-cation tolerance protein CutA [Blastocatellia bacterium]|nr:divalent-cation tolerance protein CutA [Blastocatellia bacterium]
MSSELIILVTVPSRDEGARIADALVSERLAACVNIVPGIESVYRWEGKVQRDQELLLIIKTAARRYDEVERRVKELHSYTTAEVIACDIKYGSEDYLKWVRESTGDDRTQE